MSSKLSMQNKPENIQISKIESEKEQLESADFWYQIVSGDVNENYDQKMQNLLKKELPTLSSLILERTCNLSCRHCAFQDEKSTSILSKNTKLESKILNIVTQLPENSSVVHEGRILRDWHIDILENIKRIRPDISIGMIDNGSYLKQEKKLKAGNFKFDWLDISIDGTKEIHNQQRNSPRAYDMAINGLTQARNFVRGRVTSLYTATKLNHSNIYEAVKPLIDDHLIDEFYVVPQGPTFREENLLMDTDEWKVFWESFKKAYQFGMDKNIPINFKFYKPEDIMKLAETVGYQNFISGFNNVNNVMAGCGVISFEVDGIKILYQPVSISCTETFAIDVDGAYRLPYCVKYTLDQLSKPENADYTVAFINSGDSYQDLYEKGVEHWWSRFGKEMLQEEKNIFKEIRSKSKVE